MTNARFHAENEYLGRAGGPILRNIQAPYLHIDRNERGLSQQRTNESHVRQKFSEIDIPPPYEEPAGFGEQHLRAQS